jgi:hypothetical protein
MSCPPKLRGCRRNCLHRELVESYRAERARQEAAAEVASIGYATEHAEYVEANPLPTFRDWLLGSRERAA